MPRQAENGSTNDAPPPKTTRTGRRAGPSTTRKEILDAARTLFAELGYERATLRGVANRAGVNQALIYHFFDTKDDLLAAALELPVDPAFIAAGLHDNPGHEGEELMRRTLAAWRQPAAREYLQALLRSGVSHEHAAELLRAQFSTRLAEALAAVFPNPDVQLRAALVGSQIAGIAVMRLLIGLDVLADADDDTLIRAVGPTLQRYLNGDLS